MSPKRRKTKHPRLIMLDVGQVFDLDERIARLERLCDQSIDTNRLADERLRIVSAEIEHVHRIVSLAESSCALLGAMMERRSAAARKANETRKAAAEADDAAEQPAEQPAEGTSGD